MDAQVRAAAIVAKAAAYAYAMPRVYDAPADPQLCGCQRLRPVPGTDRCRRCVEEEGN